MLHQALGAPEADGQLDDLEGVEQAERLGLAAVDLERERRARRLALRAVDAVGVGTLAQEPQVCLLYTSPSPRDRTRSRMPSSA